jgi:hypothetical protein
MKKKIFLNIKMEMMMSFSSHKKMTKLRNKELILQLFSKNFSKIQFKNSVLVLKDPHLENEF